MALGNEDFAEIDVSTNQRVKDYIVELAYARAGRKELNFIYNGIRPSDAGTTVKGPVSLLMPLLYSSSKQLCVEVSGADIGVDMSD